MGDKVEEDKSARGQEYQRTRVPEDKSARGQECQRTRVPGDESWGGKSNGQGENYKVDNLTRAARTVT
ncbi:hypothetical protein Pmani_030385 [Petrolisthes manimaculis]|uniref:Uncharacterized protein n=1 Tax=Petrolisthes manimaculis TaxID=1843537 RepID=A0AAE1NXJ3_9EUCA|nr:hypothetical protein Pmani_030385 [Petrolisthes manimaculis]